MKLSVIIPFCNEYPQVIFTIRAIAEELNGTNFEIIAVNNYCEEANDQEKDYIVRDVQEDELVKVRGRRFEDKGGEMIEGSVRACGFELKSLQYTAKLSHWNAKNEGLKVATGDVFYFADGHVLPSKGSISRMFKEYRENYMEKGTMSLPLTYKILDSRRLIYKLYIDEDGSVHYKFTPMRGGYDSIFEVPCMSCCGVMVSRSIMDRLGGGWPSLLGIYGGGENFFNFVLRTIGIGSFIYTGGTLFHFGDNREYHWNYTDFSRNRGIANYMIGGKRYLETFLAQRKLDPNTRQRVYDQITKDKGCLSRREYIKTRQQLPIITWLDYAKYEGWLDGEENFRRFDALKEMLK